MENVLNGDSFGKNGKNKVEPARQTGRIGKKGDGWGDLDRSGDSLDKHLNQNNKGKPPFGK